MSARAQRYAQRQRLQISSSHSALREKVSNSDFRSRLRSIGASEERPKSPAQEPQTTDAVPRQVMEQFETAFALHAGPPSMGMWSTHKKGYTDTRARNLFKELAGTPDIDMNELKLTT